MSRLYRDLVVIECRLASLALAGGDLALGARLVARASYYLGLRARAALQDADVLGSRPR